MTPTQPPRGRLRMSRSRTNEAARGAYLCAEMARKVSAR